jgi:hypothetical protein
MLAILVAVLVAQVSAPQSAPASDLRRLTLSTQTVLAEIDTSRLQGDPVGLAWNADGTIYLRMARGKTGAGHYLIATTTPVSFGQTDQVPAWAAEYWGWKAAMTAPGDPSLKIDTEKRRERGTSVNTVSGGELAGMQAGGADPTGGGQGAALGQVAVAAQTSVMSDIVTLRFKGQVVGEWVNQPPQPGIRFGWAPGALGMLAYIDAEGRLLVIDREGHKLAVPGTSKALLPAWSLDATRIVYLQKKSARVYELRTVSIH